jgi:hypothetical protein
MLPALRGKTSIIRSQNIVEKSDLKTRGNEIANEGKRSDIFSRKGRAFANRNRD